MCVEYIVHAYAMLGLCMELLYYFMVTVFFVSFRYFALVSPASTSGIRTDANGIEHVSYRMNAGSL